MSQMRVPQILPDNIELSERTKNSATSWTMIIMDSQYSWTCRFFSNHNRMNCGFMTYQPNYDDEPSK